MKNGLFRLNKRLCKTTIIPFSSKLKPYPIHILAVPALTPDTFDLPPENNAVIVCTKRTNGFIRSLPPENTLIIDFPDVEDKRFPGAFSKAHARRIAAFIKRLPEGVSDVYVCCSKGGSRSPAVAAALLRGSGRSDSPVWDNPYYVPNTLVYYRLCREIGVPVTRLSVRMRVARNERAYKNAQKNGGSMKYDRWEIIE